MATRPSGSQTTGRILLVLFALSYVALSLAVSSLLYLRWIKVEAAVYAYENRSVRTKQELEAILLRVEDVLPDPALKTPTMKTIDGMSNKLKGVASDLRKLKEMHTFKVPASER